MMKTKVYKNLWRKGKILALSAITLMTGSALTHAQVSSYPFTQSAGTYTAVTGGTLIGQATNALSSAAPESAPMDDFTYSANLPFNFNFNGQVYDSVRINTNGWISFGTVVTSVSTPISSTTGFGGVICPFGHDLMGIYATSGITTTGSATIANVANTSRCKVGAAIQGAGIPAGTTIASFTANSITLSAAATATVTSGIYISFAMGEVRMVTSGTAPNRTAIIQFSGMAKYSGSLDAASNNNAIDFQIRLSETSNIISIVYGPTLMSGTGSYTSQVGLRGAAATDYNNRTSTTSWSASTAGTSNSAAMTWSSSILPALGQTYTWTPATCLAPVAVTVASTTAFSTTASWAAPTPAPANGYEYYVSTSSTAPTASTVASGTIPAGATTALIPGLVSGTVHYLWIRSVCSGTDKSGWSNVISFTTLVTCGAPTAVTVPNITANTALISWTAPTIGPPIDYQYEVRTSGAAGSGTTGLVASGNPTATSATAGGLTPSTAYSVYVRTNCGTTNGNSTWTSAVTFNTSCIAFAAPWLDSVEAMTATTSSVIANCWSSTPSNTTSSYRWDVASNGTTPSTLTGPAVAYSGQKYFYAEASSGSTGAVAELISPDVNLAGLTTPMLEFYYHMYGSTMGNLYIDAYNGTSWTTLDSIKGQQQTTEGAAWLKKSILLTGYTGTVKIKFRSIRGTDFYGDMSIDNIGISQAPSCNPPTGLATNTVTPVSANLSWVAPAVGTPVSYQWEVRSSGAAGSGATGLAASGTTTVPTVTASVSGLLANTTYSVYVRSQCGPSSFSAWTNALTLNTPCAVYPTPFLETFEGTFAPGCWSMASGILATPTVFGTTNNYWNQANYGNASIAVASSINKAARINIYGTDRKDWLITPSIDLGATAKQLEFDMSYTVYSGSGSATLGADDTVAVVISTDNGVTWTQANALSMWNSTTPLANGSGYHYIINLGTYSGIVKLAFYGESTVSNVDNDLFIDNVKVVNVPSCQVPQSVAISAITAATATVTWTASSSASPAGYEWEIRTTGAAGSGPTGLAASGSTVAPTVTANATGLASNTLYAVYVRTNCGAGNFSAWSTMTNFTTLCSVYPVPFLETFEGTTFVPGCWSQASGLMGTPTVFGTTNNFWNQANYADASVAVGTSTNKAARINIYTTTRKDWLITPSINLGTIPRQLEFDIAYTVYASSSSATLGIDDTVSVVISTDNGVTWSRTNVLRSWNNTTPIANGAGNHITVDLTAYTGVVKLAFYGESTVSNVDNDLFIDNVSVVTNPCPSVNLGPDVTACSNVSFSQTLNAGNPGATYLWDNASTAQTRTVTAAGTYYVAVTMGACTKRDTMVVTFSAPPVVNLGNDTTICAGNTVTMNAGNAGATYVWDNATTAQTRTVSAAGTYYVAVTGTNTCIGRDTLVLTVNALPVVNLGNDTAFCAGDSVTLDASVTGTAYLWDDASTASTRTVGIAGTYFVAVTDANTCVGHDTITVTENALPVVSLGNDTLICNGVTLTLDAANAGAIYLWDDASTAQTRDINTAGTYSVSVTDANGCSASDTVDVSQIVAASGTIQSVNNGEGSYTFSVGSPVNVTVSNWDYGDQSTGTGSPVNHTYAANGDYVVTLTLVGLCDDTVTVTQALKVDGITSLNKVVLGADELMLFPNPAKSVINITNKSGLRMQKVIAFNILGQQVYSAAANSGNNHQVDISGLASGVYTLKIETEKGSVIRKFEVLK